MGDPGGDISCTSVVFSKIRLSALRDATLLVVLLLLLSKMGDRELVRARARIGVFDLVLRLGIGDFDLVLRLGIGDFDLVLRLGIGDLDLRLGIGDFDLVLRLGIGDFDLRLGMGDFDLVLRLGGGERDLAFCLKGGGDKGRLSGSRETPHRDPGLEPRINIGETGRFVRAPPCRSELIERRLTLRGD